MFPSKRSLGLIFSHEDNAIDFLLQVGIIKRPSLCINCGWTYLTRERKLWRCLGCRKTKSILAGSFFSKTKLGVNEVLEIGYYWLAKVSRDSIVSITGHSSATITKMLDYYRQLVVDDLDFENLIIGGPGIVVEIDEAKFGKRMYNRGHRVEGAWVLGGVERTPERKIFLVEVPDRRAETLLDIIVRHVHPDSIIYTDCFSSYHRLVLLGFRHVQVNHSLHFVDPITGCHTNTIEGTWCGIKMTLKQRNRVTGIIDDFLGEFIWRRKHYLRLWDALLDAFIEIIYV